MIRIRPKLIFINVSIIGICLFCTSAAALAHSGGIDDRGGHTCRTDCEQKGFYSGEYHFHPERMNAAQSQQYEKFRSRICDRVERRFSDNQKMWQRVNKRVQKRFGFVCSKTQINLNHKAASVEDQQFTEIGFVNRIVDGDTVKVQMNDSLATVRIIGIDTPETVHPNKPVECFGKEAAAFLRGLIDQKSILLIFEPDNDEDYYGRKLRYIEVDNEDIGLKMISEGYAFSYKKYPHIRKATYDLAEQSAMKNSVGLWGESCEY